MIDFKVKGSHIVECRDFVDERLGAGAYASTWTKVGGAWNPIVLPGAWYEVATAEAALRDVCVRTGDNIIAMQAAIAGRNAEHDLTTIYRVFLRIAQPSRLINAIPRLWRNYVSGAAGRSLSNERGRAILECAGVPDRFEDWVVGCWLGFIPCAIRLAGGRDPRITLSRREREAEDFSRLEFTLEYGG